MLEEMKEQSRLPVCPHRVGHYPFCMTNRRKTIPEQRRALDTTGGTQGRAGVCGGAGSAGFVQGGTKDTRLPVLGNLCPLECGALGLGVLYCSPSSLGWVPGWRGWLGPAPRQPLPPRATHQWRSTVCSASVLRRRWEGAAGSRGGPGPVGRRGRLRLRSSPRRASSGPLTRPLDWAPVAPASPSLEAQVWLPVCSSRGCCGAEGGEPPQFQSCSRPDPALGLTGLPGKLPDQPRMRARPQIFLTRLGLLPEAQATPKTATSTWDTHPLGSWSRCLLFSRTVQSPDSLVASHRPVSPAAQDGRRVGVHPSGRGSSDPGTCRRPTQRWGTCAMTS